MSIYSKRFSFTVRVFLLLILPIAGVKVEATESGGSAEKPASAKRTLPLDNTENTRDLGGYQTIDGHSVKWGMLFRSDSIAELDEQDLNTLQSLELAVVTDFRSEAERAEAPDRLPIQSSAIDYRTLAINNPAVDVEALRHKVYSGALSSADLLKLTDRRVYVTDPAMRSAWGGWLRSLSEPGALPQLFHCTAGKDRTGFAAALVLLTLGVSRDQVMADFMLSNTMLEARIHASISHIEANAQGNVDREALAQVIGVSPTSLLDAFAEMEARYGSIDNYISEGLGVNSKTRQLLRAKLLE